MLQRKRAPLLSLLAICFSIISAQAQETNKDILGAIRYRHIGPTGNRLTSAVDSETKAADLRKFARLCVFPFSD